MSDAATSLADAAVDKVLQALVEGAPSTIVDSPPGAGKTRLVTQVIAFGVVEAHLRVLVVAPRNEQVYEILRRLPRRSDLPIHVLRSQGSPLPDDLAADPAVGDHTSAVTLPAGPGVVLANTSKGRISTDPMSDGSFDLLIVDEAYQVPFAHLLPLLVIAQQVILVGDPGQLPPIVQSDTARLEAAEFPVHQPAPKLLAKRRPESVRVALPLTFRFPQDTVDLIQPSLYPQLPFASAVGPEERSLVLKAAGMGTPIDRAIDMVAQGLSVVALRLPPMDFGPDEVDVELADLAAAVAHRIVERGPEWSGVGDLGPGAIGIGDSHVASGTETHRRLVARGVRGVEVTTPEIWQGRQRALMILKHPLSGARTLGEFSLDPGRLCVLLSRHQIGCIVLMRGGMVEALDRYRHDSGRRPTGSENPVWAGWLAHRQFSQDLAGRVVDVDS